MRFVLSILCAVCVAAGCSSSSTTTAFDRANLPAGDAARGAELFTLQVGKGPVCSTCHTLDGAGGGQGPTLLGYGETAKTRVNGESAEEYTYNSITRPAKVIVTGYSNVMYADFAQELDGQQIADLIAFLLEQ